MRYHSFDRAMRGRFGCKVYKLSLDGGFGCPNRDGTVGARGCSFCSARGSGEFAASAWLPIEEQLACARARVAHKNPGGKYIAYFQSYTNTYAPPERLRSLFSAAAAPEDIVALDEYFDDTQASARYLAAHEKDLAKCPEDSVLLHTGIVYADVSVALSHDALELLKMSTLFPKIGDNNLSMKIIRAYDACDLTVSNVARYLTRRDNHRAEVARWLIDQPIPEEYMDTGDIQDAIDAIDTFLRK